MTNLQTTCFTDEELALHALEEFDLMDIEHLQDAYMGHNGSGEEFADNFVNECYGLPEMPSWIAIYWKETWEDGLSWDYTFYDGFVFCNHF